MFIESIICTLYNYRELQEYCPTLNADVIFPFPVHLNLFSFFLLRLFLRRRYLIILHRKYAENE